MLNNYYFDNLNLNEKNAYNSIYSAISSNNEETTLYNISQDECMRAWKAVFLDHAELIKCTEVFFLPQIGNGYYRCRFEYSLIDENQFYSKLDNLVQRINQKLPVNASSYFILKKIHDYLTSSIKYDFKVFNEYINLKRSSDANSANSQNQKENFLAAHSAAFTPYGVLISLKGVCNGIAKLFKLLCNRFGIECVCVECRLNNEPHMINVVEIDNKRYFVDITNCLKIDHLPIRYDYFLISKVYMERLCKIDTDFGCNYNDKSFFHMNKLIFKSINDLRQYLESYTYNSTNGEIRIQYCGSKLSDSQLSGLITDIIIAHCGSGFSLYKTYYVKNGFFTGLIIRDREM